MELLADDPKSAKYRETLARSYNSLGLALRGRDAVESLREAVAIHQQLVAEFPEVAQYRFHLATSYERLGHLGSKESESWCRQAIDLFEQLLAESPGVYAYRERLAATRKTLGDYLMGAGRVHEAEEVLRDAHNRLAKLAEEFPNARGYESDFRDICCNLARLSRSRHEFTEARSYFEQAIYHYQRRLEASPDFGWARLGLGQSFTGLASTLLHLGEYQRAEEACREAIAVLEKLDTELPNQADPGWPGWLANAYTQLAVVLSATGQSHEAEKAYRKILELKPDSAVALNNIAWILVTCPDPKFRDVNKALELAQKAVELAPQSCENWNTLGVARYRAGEWKDAIESLEKSEGLKPGQYFSFNAFFLAMAHWQLDEKEEARKGYDQAVEWMEKNKPADEELKRFRAEAAELLKQGSGQ